MYIDIGNISDTFIDYLSKYGDGLLLEEKTVGLYGWAVLFQLLCQQHLLYAHWFQTKLMKLFSSYVCLIIIKSSVSLNWITFIYWFSQHTPPPPPSRPKLFVHWFIQNPPPLLPPKLFVHWFIQHPPKPSQSVWLHLVTLLAMSNETYLIPPSQGHAFLISILVFQYLSYPWRKLFQINQYTKVSWKVQRLTKILSWIDQMKFIFQQGPHTCSLVLHCLDPISQKSSIADMTSS